MKSLAPEPACLLLLLLQVVGEAEKAEGTVNVRTRDNQVHGMHKLEAVLDVLRQEKATRSLTSLFGHKEGEGEAAAADGEKA